MSKDTPDYSAYSEEEVDQTALKRLTELSAKFKKAELLMAETEKAAKAAKAAFNEVSMKELPEYMLSLDIDEYKNASSGLHIVLKDAFGVSLPKKDPVRYIRGLDWIEDRGDGKLIKRDVRAKFTKGQEAAAKAFTQRLLDEGFQATCMREVHPSTLKSYLKDLDAQGEEIPEDIFGVHRGKVATVK